MGYVYLWRRGFQRDQGGFLEEVIPVRQVRVNSRKWSLFLAFSFP